LLADIENAGIFSITHQFLLLIAAGELIDTFYRNTPNTLASLKKG
jgi:hypothetical protein